MSRSTPQSLTFRVGAQSAMVFAGLLLSAGCEASEEDPELLARCALPPALNQTFSVPQATGDRSFQAHATFDGEAIWLTHAGVPVDEEGIFVSALRFHCDGSVASPSVRISEQNGLQTEPRISRHKDSILLAWQRDDQVSAQNLSTHFVVFDSEIGPAGIAATHLDTQYQGASAGNTWMPELASSESGFVVAGLRGVSDFNSFQAFAQRVDATGVLEGEAINGQLTDSMSQQYASASLDDEGGVILGWTRTEADDSEHVVHVQIKADSDAPEGDPIRVTEGQGSMPALARNRDNGSFLVFNAPDGSVSVKSSTLFDPQAPVLELRPPGGQAIYPRVAVGPNGGAVAWLELISGYDTEVHVQAFTGDGSDMSKVGDGLTIVTDAPAIGPYGLSVSHIQDSIYSVTWTEGPVSDLQVKWRLFEAARN